MKKYVPNFKAACKITGDDPNKLPDTSWMPEARAKSVLAHYQLDIIATAQNKGCMPDGSDFVPDFSKINQFKWFPIIWYNPSLRRFVYTYAYSAGTDAHLGARLATNTAEKADYIGKNFNKEWNEFLYPQI